MKLKVIKVLVSLDLLLVLASVGLLLYVSVKSPQIEVTGSSIHCPHISFGKSIRATVVKNRSGLVLFYNRDAPYMGSAIGVAEDEASSANSWSFLGISFISIEYAGQPDSKWWTLGISIITFTVIRSRG